MAAVSQIRPGLYLSGLDPALSLAVLASRSITLIVNASDVDGVSYPQREGLQVLSVPVPDRPHAPLSSFFDVVSERILQNQTGSTLVHCTAGRSRSPTLLMAHLMRCEGLTLRGAYELVLDRRSFIRPNAGFWRQLIDYEMKLFGRNTILLQDLHQLNFT